MSETRRDATDSAVGNRWLILVAGVLVQLAIGAVYAWSVFSKALQSDAAFGWSKSQATVPFEVAIGMIFIGSYLGGRIQDRRGPRSVALTGGVIYSIGVVLASFATTDSFWLLVLGYGVLGGFGLGMVYIVPIAMLQKWFPDKPGLITGIAVAGFGFGAVITAPVGQRLIDNTPDLPTKAFLPLGIGYLVAIVIGASLFKNPPADYRPPGFAAPPHALAGAGRADRPAASRAGGPAADTDVDPLSGTRNFTANEALSTPQWYLLTAILTLSVVAGISLISVAAGSASDITGLSSAGAATLVGVLGLFNGAGRVLWGWLSDRIGKMPAFMGILAIQGVCLLLIPHASSVGVFALLAALVYTCYGGAFGTMPSTAGRFFGVKNAGAIYGLMLIGWSIGGVVGPLLISKLIGEDKSYSLGFTVIGIIALVAIAVPLVTKKPAPERAAEDAAV
ncbi:L-lactate MFS transporter [Pedococcus bigeumensis]|uniref:MFS transporter n=1 Tax=Pedococcus bigeumensis TaxID=433644 RepID=A0A502CMK7_9MICO|nr:OFA family MFS transporter [Pedococcus bigeumensis]TPG12921.1 MFS transporter [Pedococcus bigeumensis]